MSRRVIVILLSLHCTGFAAAQSTSPTQPWPDNIIITKRLLQESRVDENQATRVERGVASICAQLGKLYEPGTVRKVSEGDIVTGVTTYLSGRKKLVITESLMLADKRSETCIGKYRLGWTYDYSGPGEAWTVVRAPDRVYSPARPQRSSNAQTLERAFQGRLRKFQGEWRTKQYSEIETRFGHRCGYPPNPADLPRPQGMGEYGAIYDQAVGAVQGFHAEGPKLCSLIGSPQHVGTGEKLFLHFKDPQRNFDDQTGCYDMNDSGDMIKKKCIPIVVDFRINAAMPVGIFEKPQ